MELFTQSEMTRFFFGGGRVISNSFVFVKCYVLHSADQLLLTLERMKSSKDKTSIRIGKSHWGVLNKLHRIEIGSPPGRSKTDSSVLLLILFLSTAQLLGLRYHQWRKHKMSLYTKRPEMLLTSHDIKKKKKGNFMAEFFLSLKLCRSTE